MKNINILFLEDDQDLRESVSKLLISAGYKITAAKDLRSAKEKLNDDLDLAIIDINLPDGDGTDFLKDFKKTYKTPAILMTTKKTVEDRVKGLEDGADYYLPKPIVFDELNSVIKNLIRNYEIGDEQWILNEFDLSILTPKSKRIKLNKNEFAVLKHICKSKDLSIERDNIATIMEKKYDPLDRSYDMLISRIRKKIDPNNEMNIFSSIRGKGYKFLSNISIK